MAFWPVLDTTADDIHTHIYIYNTLLMESVGVHTSGEWDRCCRRLSDREGWNGILHTVSFGVVVVRQDEISLSHTFPMDYHDVNL